ncbi:hypothetical protein BJ742DRAFT_816704 [Cladochytrium replicatum]|nr:hypothetical protein BJ742DRAFT_816704 [Cladochytrium replicatum]
MQNSGLPLQTDPLDDANRRLDDQLRSYRDRHRIRLNPLDSVQDESEEDFMRRAIEMTRQLEEDERFARELAEADENENIVLPGSAAHDGYPGSMSQSSTLPVNNSPTLDIDAELARQLQYSQDNDDDDIPFIARQPDSTSSDFPMRMPGAYPANPNAPINQGLRQRNPLELVLEFMRQQDSDLVRQQQQPQRPTGLFEFMRQQEEELLRQQSFSQRNQPTSSSDFIREQRESNPLRQQQPFQRTTGTAGTYTTTTIVGPGFVQTVTSMGPPVADFQTPFGATPGILGRGAPPMHMLPNDLLRPPIFAAPFDALANDDPEEFRAFRTGQLRQFLLSRFGVDLGEQFLGQVDSYESLLDLAERIGPARPRGVNEDQFESLPIVKYDSSKSDEKNTCSICLSDFENGEELVMFPKCTHSVHKECGEKWLKQSNSCPICRVEVVGNGSGSGGSSGGGARDNAGGSSSS